MGEEEPSGGTPPRPREEPALLFPPRPPPRCHIPLADIPPEERLPDYNSTLVWEDDVEESTRPLRQVSENTTKALKAAFGRPITIPERETTKCQKLDPAAKQLLQRDQKQGDALLEKLQTLVLDAVAPLVHIEEEAGKGTLSGEVAADADKAALS